MESYTSELHEYTIYSCRPFVVNEMLSLQTSENILHGVNSSAERRSWPGIVTIDSKGGRFHGLKDVVCRGFGRSDYNLSDALYERLVCQDDQEKIVKQAHELAQCHDISPSSLRYTYHIMVVRPQAVNQEYHFDNDEAEFYYTLLFPLTFDTDSCGYTEFRNIKVPQCRPGQLLVFDGKTEHRGLANRSTRPRVFMYVVLNSSVSVADGNLAQKAGSSLLHEPDVRSLKTYTDQDAGEIKVGEIWEFAPDSPTVDSLWVGRIEGIFKGRREKIPTLEVRWFYSPMDANVRGDNNERLFSAHFDETSVRSLLRKVAVKFQNIAHWDAKTSKERYFCFRCFDHATRKTYLHDRMLEKLENLDKESKNAWVALKNYIRKSKAKIQISDALYQSGNSDADSVSLSSDSELGLDESRKPLISFVHNASILMK
jgi:hypothetical protein